MSTDLVVTGMTGLRNGVTETQLAWMYAEIPSAAVLHHGACIGADEESHYAALSSGVYVVVHPPTNQSKMMKLDADPRVTILDPKPYFDRNRDIVDSSDKMIAFPDGPERPDGGTWYTIRYAVSRSKPVAICYPDGTLEIR